MAAPRRAPMVPFVLISSTSGSAPSTTASTLPPRQWTPSVNTPLPTTASSVPATAEATRGSAALTSPPKLGTYSVERPTNTTPPSVVTNSTAEPTLTSAAPKSPPKLGKYSVETPLSTSSTCATTHGTISAPLVEVTAPLPAPAPSGVIHGQGFRPFTQPTVNPTAPQIFSANHIAQITFANPTAVSKGNSVVQLISQLQIISRHFSDAWYLLLGLYLQESGRSPFQLGCQGLHNDWEPDFLRMDRLARNPTLDLGQWVMPTGEPLFSEVVQQIWSGNQWAFEEVVRSWAITTDQQKLTWVVARSGWRTGWDRSAEWYIVDSILKMDNGEEKERKVAAAKAEAPRFFQKCEDDLLFCGVQNYRKRHIRSEDDDPDYEYESEYTVRALRVKGQSYRVEYPKSPRKKRKIEFTMATGPGQPTQFHGVPLEERAIDSKGNRLPWALEYHEDHPSARGQKRHPEEKGPFGKSLRRKGSSRTRTATPAKKENPTLDGFEQALKYDAKKAAESKDEANPSTRAQDDTNVTPRHTPSHTKEPTQIMIYGYPASKQYAAIDLYEKCSGGMICEDYEREPPAELLKYPKTFSASRSVHQRSLTKQEKALAFKYDGGSHWIKLTCDSAESAARAVEQSPVQVYGHWVYAELYNGKAPVSDQPIPITEEDRRQGPFNSPRPPRRSSQSLSAAFSQQASTKMRATSTLPRSFNPNLVSSGDTQQAQEASSLSSSTASSATATNPEHSNLRHRHPSPAEHDAHSPNSNEIAPGIPRYVLRPASEAFLPQPTWWERQVQWLRAQGMIPTDFIGDGLPLLENGEFDWAKASWYWRICYWFDCHLGTDICGLKDG